MKKFTILSEFIFLILFCNSIHSQDIKNFGTKGVWELGGTVYYSNTTTISNDLIGGKYGIFQIQPVAGYFVRKGLELGIQPSITISNQYGHSNTDMSLYFAPAYNMISSGKIFPALVALIGYTSHKSDYPENTSLGGFSWGFQLDAKINLLGNSLLVVSLQYVQTTLNAPGATSRSGGNTLTFGAGWNVFF